MNSKAIDALVEAFCYLPGIGPKSAERLVYHLLSRSREQGFILAARLEETMRVMQRCERCNNFWENTLCALCSNPRRDTHTLCVVESPADQSAIERSGIYQGLYFVLMGYLSPLDGLGPHEIGLDRLLSHLDTFPIQEVIIATNRTVQGEATAHYIYEMTRPLGIRTSRIAHGVPVGSELEHIDIRTLAHAVMGRELISS